MPNVWRLAGFFVLFVFGLCVLDLPVHLVHHLGEVNPDCQLLGLSVSLNASIFDNSWLPPVERTWDEIVIPCTLPDISLSVETPQARSPPATT